MGDTLISLGLVGPVDIFRAIRDQGRDRVADLFVWKTGKVAFYRGQLAPHVEFPLDLDLPSLMIAGLEAAHPADTPLETWRDRLDRSIAISNEDRRSLGGVAWPATVARVLSLVATPKPIREVLKTAARAGGTATPADVLRAIEVLAAAKLVKIA
jgi:hypothetical protein